MTTAAAYLDASATPARRTRDLVGRMTLREKVGQLVAAPFDAVPLPAASGFLRVRGRDLDAIAAHVRTEQERLLSGTRLRIPALPFSGGPLPGTELVPPPLGLAASWDRELVHEVAWWVAEHARAAGVRLVQGPALTVADDLAAAGPAGSFGGDPLLVSELVTAHVRGTQGGGQVGCAALDLGGAAGALDGTDARVGERRLRSWVLPPGRAAVLAGVAVVVPAPTLNGGIPLHADQWLLQTVLREEWGFTGAVLGRGQAVTALHRRYGVASSVDDALALVLEAGVDAVSGCDPTAGDPTAGDPTAGDPTAFNTEDTGVDARAAERMVGLVRRGALPEWLLDDAVAAVLHLKFRLGLFEDPYPADERRRLLARAGTGDLLTRAVVGSAVLLSDPQNMLPVGARRCRVVPVPGPGAAGAAAATGIAEALQQELARAGARPVGPAGAPGDVLTVAVVTCLPGEAAGEVARLSVGGAHCVALLCHPRLDGVGEVLATLSAAVWCCGAAAGTAGALAGLLTGSRPPAGRLPLAIGAARTGGGADLPLGHGLGPTRFVYSNLRVAPTEPLVGEAVIVSCRVANPGTAACDEVVQVYVRDRVASVVRPERVLAGFASVRLQPGESREVRIVLPSDRFALWDRGMRQVVEPGSFDVLVGRSGAEILLHAEVVVQQRDEPPPER